MNHVEVTVTEIITTPRFYRLESASWWEVEIAYDSNGYQSVMKLIYSTREAAEEVVVGGKVRL